MGADREIRDVYQNQLNHLHGNFKHRKKVICIAEFTKKWIHIFPWPLVIILSD